MDAALLAPVFFLIALFYSMMGFGGGSSYLAALALSGLPHSEIPPVALACNLVVAGTGFLQFRRAGHFDFRKLLPFVLLSVPMAYLGGRIPVGKQLFFFLLGAALLAVALRMLIRSEPAEIRIPCPRTRWVLGLSLGAAIGFLSGLLGIGGGIFLSPLLLLMRWADSKQAAASASFFILVNSAAALAGHLHKVPFHWTGILPLAAAVFLGGQAGSRLGAFHIPRAGLQRMVGGFVLYASLKLLARCL